MDAETRHSLKENDFAKALSKLGDLNDRQLGIGLAVLAVIIAAWAGWRFWSGAQATANAGAWSELAQVNPAPDQGGIDEAMTKLRNLADRDGSVGAAALLRMARAKLDQAATMGDAPQGQDLIKEALELTRRGLQDASSGSALRPPLLFLQATAYESLRQPDDAKKIYEQFTSDKALSVSPFAQLAIQRLDTVADAASTVKFEPGLPPAPEPAVAPTPSVSGPAAPAERVPIPGMNQQSPPPASAPASESEAKPQEAAPAPANDTPDDGSQDKEGGAGGR